MKEQNIEILKRGGVGVAPTDTIYGLLGLALNKKTVERIYQVRKRQPDKPLIILIQNLEDLKLFGIKLDTKTTEILNQYWPGKVSVVLPISSKKMGLDSRLRGNDTRGGQFAYLHRGTNTLAFRLPKNKQLQKLLKETGTLVAPSANLEGQPPAKNITEAKKYFKNQIDFYQSGKITSSQPSTLIKIDGNKITILRAGAIKIKTNK